ncbi:MAG: Ig-like domain-containing protein [Oscillospiraceae bacterium]|nr:Ig-like domain-containing protein [Oscillospiraceae bacterium]
MDKIICDVCGTSYSESAEQCPICLRARAGGAKTVADDIVLNEAQPSGGSTGSGARVRGGRFSKSNVRKRNRNMPIYDMPEEKPRTKANPDPDADGPYDFGEEPRKSKSNVVLNVLLVIVILALLCVTGYIFKEYFLPGILAQTEQTAAPTVATVPPTDAPTEPAVTEEPTIPCTGLEWSDGEDFVLLEGLGESWLLNVVVTPADTTDSLAYYSSDESVVTVDSEGCVTAVGEGEATVVVSCGGMELQCDVVCVFATEAPTEEPGEDGGEEPTAAPGEGEEEEPTEPLKDIKLEVNYTDITLTGHGQQFTFKVTGLTNEEVTWTSDNENVVTVENGTVTRVAKGTANITVKYGDQEVVIIVRCR